MIIFYKVLYLLYALLYCFTLCFYDKNYCCQLLLLTNTLAVDRLVHIFTFDKHGLLRSHVGKVSNKDIGDGSSFQFIFTVEEMFDTNYLEKNPVQQDWGFALLKSIPQNLNLNQSLNSGAHGLEQLGTPKAVGQRTLEMH